MARLSTWTAELDADLTKYWREGHSTAEIGRKLGVTKNAIVGRAARIHLDGRPSPIRRDPPKVDAEPTPPPPLPARAETLPPLASLSGPPPLPPPQMEAVPAPVRRHHRIDETPIPTEGHPQCDACGSAHLPASAPRVGSPAPERCEPPPLRPVMPLGRGLPAPVRRPVVVRMLPPPEPEKTVATVFRERKPGRCAMPMWGNERTKFGADGDALVCGEPATHDSYCDQHWRATHIKVPRRA